MSKAKQKVISVSKALIKNTQLGHAKATTSPSPASVSLPKPIVPSSKPETVVNPLTIDPSEEGFVSSPSMGLSPPSSITVREQNMNLNWPIPDLTKSHFIWKARSTITVFMVGLWSKSVLSLMNKTKILNKERMTNAIFNRPEGTALVTVSNHESCIDDPTIIASFMSIRQLTDQKRMRWSLSAYDICYRTKLEGSFFSLGKCAPVVRGDGVYQKAIDFSIERVNAGDWVHIFPEGRINTEREDLYRLKWGVGRILSECRKPVLIIPFWHTGMVNVLPNHPPYLPRFGKKVFINVGEAIDISEILKTIHGKSAMERRKILTDFIQGKLKILREETLLLANAE